MSQYRIQVIDADGNVAHSWVPGSVVEQEIVSTVTKKIMERGVGFWRTEANVRDKVEQSLLSYLHDLKARVKPHG